MSDSSWLWAVFTIIAAAAQTVRNAAQRELTSTLGTVGATHVRFLFGCPFALVILAGVLLSGAALPRPGRRFLAVGARRRADADRGDRADARRHGRAVVRGRDRLHQDRAHTGRAVRPAVPRRPRDRGDGRRDRDRDRRRHRDVAQGRPAPAGGSRATDPRPVGGRLLRPVGDRISRRHPQPRTIPTT